jgi:3-oxoacyl-[acyl-carrier-protein] synthase-3
MIYSKILGTGSYLPPQRVTNADWAKSVETTDAWIFERTGIKSRHFAPQDETAAGMAFKAAQAALAMAGKAAADIGMIIVATGTPDKIFPSTACIVQKKLQAPIGPAFDIQAACSGFIYALSIADQFIKSGQIQTALVIGSEMMSRLIDWSDRGTCVLFGDGAGAVLLGASDKPGIFSTKIVADGKLGDLLTVDNMQLGDHSQHLAHLTTTENLNSELNSLNPYVKMNGRQVFKNAVHRLEALAREVQNESQRRNEPIDWLVPHQANIRIIQAMADKLGLSMEKVICTVETHSNTSSASIPLALDTAIRAGKIKRGQNLLFEAFGGGLTWGSAFLKF